MAEYTDDELKAALEVGTGKRHGLDSRVIEKYKEVQIHGPVALSSDIACAYVHPRHQQDPTTKGFHSSTIEVEAGREVRKDVKLRARPFSAVSKPNSR